MIIYKLEHYTAYQVSSGALYSNGGINLKSDESFNYFYNNYHSKNKEILAPLPFYVKVTNNTIENTPEFNLEDLYTTELTPASTLWVHPNCTIPRAKVFQKYKRTIKPEKANFCILPKLPKYLKIQSVAVFINKEKHKIYYIDSCCKYINGNWVNYSACKCENKNLGTSILDINPALKGSTIEISYYYNSKVRETFNQENWEDFLDSTLLYYGNAVIVPTNQLYVIDLIYKKYNNVVSEDTLLSSLGDDTNEINKELCDSIIEMLNSSDDAVVSLGLKTLAELDYKRFRNTTINILCKVSRKWQRVEIKNTTSIKYMLKYLNLWDRAFERYFPNTTKEDFDLLHQLINEDFHAAVENMKGSFNCRFPFINIDLTYNFTISPKLDS